ncbi:MAG: hypothetical protein GY771_15460 [bacterium]|nr:hypothetical protein [bacterium]
MLTLAIYSFLYKDNPLYKFAEHLFIGVSAGYFLAYYFWNLFVPNLWDHLYAGFGALFSQGLWTMDLLYVFAALLGITMIFRFFPKVSWVSRYGISFTVGLGAGLSFILFLQANVVAQIRATIIPPIVITGGVFDWATSLTNTLLIIGVCTALIYFYFSKEHKGLLGGAAKVGIWFLMVSFGAAFGYTIMARISLLIGRIDFLINDWIVGTLSFLSLV